MRARIIAFYLPQYYPFKENDEWWGKGFTEWTNVGKAKSLFKGHYQPRVPSDLGYYDLRLPEVREAQAELAKEAGIEGFCYWHYWFDHKRQLMGRVFDEVLTSGTPALPFCLGWANHSWYAKTWDKDVKDKLLCEQKYLGKTDYDAHFEYVLKAFKDARYITVDGCPLFYIFDPLKLPIDFIPYWNKLAKQNGLSLSGLAKKSGLDPTIFNKSKRLRHDGKKRWPSLDSLNKIIDVCNISFDEFFALVSEEDNDKLIHSIPYVSYSDLCDGIVSISADFANNNWQKIQFPDGKDNLYALDLNTNNFAPVYREGTLLILSQASEIRGGDRVVVFMKNNEIVVAEFIRRTATTLETKEIIGKEKLSINIDDVHLVHRIVWASQ